MSNDLQQIHGTYILTAVSPGQRTMYSNFANDFKPSPFRCFNQSNPRFGKDGN